MSKLLLIDGSNLLFQMFFGMPNTIIGTNGKDIKGVWGFTGALLKICNSIKPSHVLVIFDGEQLLNRKEKDENYKKNRIDYSSIPEEENPFSILPIIKRVLDELNIKYFETNNGYETDDFINEYCHCYQDKYNIVISSHDSDLLQLVNKKISVLRYRGVKSVIYDEKLVKEKYGFNPELFADYKALIGDSADNISGIPKIGVKTASILVNKFGNVQNIIEERNKIEKISIRSSIENNQEKLLKNKKMIQLERTHDIPIKIDKLKYIPLNQSTKEILIKLNLIEKISI